MVSTAQGVHGDRGTGNAWWPWHREFMVSMAKGVHGDNGTGSS